MHAQMETREVCYFPLSKSRYVVLCYEVLLTSTVSLALQEMRRSVDFYYSNHGVLSHPDKKFQIDYFKHFKRVIADINQYFNKYRGLQQITGTCSLPDKEKDELIKAIIACACGFFQTLETTYSPKMILSDFLKKRLCRKIFSSARSFFQLNLNVIRLKKTTLSERDKRFLGCLFDSSQYDPTRLDCASYVFLQIQEGEALFWVMCALKGTQSPAARLFYTRCSVAVLEDWGYEQVRECQKGDVVLYFKDPLWTLLAHMALCIGDGRAESKMKDQPMAERHQLEDVRPSCGSYMLFFRKKRRLNLDGKA